ncbi:MAG: hypothetical protein LWW74_04730 [Burkholderiales bacterium]|nr:hypothetical protein [Burkholderiales bacterium]
MIRKTGLEPFTLYDNDLPLNVLSFWQWSSSELLGNALRGKLAEYIVASAIDGLDRLREEWDEFDLITKSGLKIEIKSSSYIQSWSQSNHSKISFGIQPTRSSLSKDSTRSRKADIYIFCVLSHKDKETVNPLALEQWDFYVLPTSILNTEIPNQKTITLSSLLSLKPVCARYENLASAIRKYEYDKEINLTA